MKKDTDEQLLIRFPNGHVGPCRRSIADKLVRKPWHRIYLIAPADVLDVATTDEKEEGNDE